MIEWIQAVEPDVLITVVVIVLALFFFITEVVSVDVVAIAVMVVLVASGVIDVEEGLKGFANSATLAVAAMFVLSRALVKTRVIESIAPYFTKLLNKGYKRTVLGLGLSVGTISAFVNNTPVVATFIPIIRNAAKRTKISPSKFLMPLSFVAIFGGTCTLIGTSTNLLVSGIAEDHSIESFSMFLMAPLGIVFFLVGTLYLLLFGERLIPERTGAEEFEEESSIKNFLTEIKIIDNLLEGHNQIQQVFKDQLDVKVSMVKRGEQVTNSPPADFSLQKNDVLLVKGDMSKIKKVLKINYLSISESLKDRQFPNEETHLIAIVLQPNFEFIGKKLSQVDFLEKYQANVLAIRQRGKQKFSDLKEISLKSGDVLLLQTSEQGHELMNNAQRGMDTPFFSLLETDIPTVDKKKLGFVLFTIVSVVGLATAGILPIVIAAFAGIVFLNVTKTITMKEAYQSIDWKVIFLLAGALSLGKAMTNSGITEELANFLVEIIGANYGPIAVISALYITTSLLTAIMSNNAAAALLAPVAISIAGGMDVSATPMLLSIAFAGSSSFMTPVGYQTNTMVYSAGNYQFTDFTKIGTPLKLIFWILATVLIPVFYPL